MPLFILSMVSLAAALALLASLSQAAPVPLPGGGPTSPTASSSACSPQASYTSAMDAVFDGHKEHYPHIINAAARFNMCSNKRFAAFVGQISHETARLTTFYQPIDQGAGALHMLPSNWGFAFDFLAKEFPNLTQGLSKDLVSVQQAIASKIMQAPEVAYLVAGWWFTDGAAIVLNQKCKNMNTFADGMSDSGSGPQDDAVMNSISQCIFGFGNDAGGPQRRSYIRAALQAFGPASQGGGSSDSGIDAVGSGGVQKPTTPTATVEPQVPTPASPWTSTETSDSATAIPLQPTSTTMADMSHPTGAPAPPQPTSIQVPPVPVPAPVVPPMPVPAPLPAVPAVDSTTVPVPTPPSNPEAMIPELPQAEWPQIQGFPTVPLPGAHLVKDHVNGRAKDNNKRVLRRVRDKVKAFRRPSA